MLRVGRFRTTFRVVMILAIVPALRPHFAHVEAIHHLVAITSVGLLLVAATAHAVKIHIVTDHPLPATTITEVVMVAIGLHLVIHLEVGHPWRTTEVHVEATESPILTALHIAVVIIVNLMLQTDMNVLGEPHLHLEATEEDMKKDRREDIGDSHFSLPPIESSIRRRIVS